MAAVSRTAYRGLRTGNHLCPVNHTSFLGWLPREVGNLGILDARAGKDIGHPPVHALVDREVTRDPLKLMSAAFPPNPRGRGFLGGWSRALLSVLQPTLSEEREAGSLFERTPFQEHLAVIDLEGDAEDAAAPGSAPTWAIPALL